MLELPEPRRVKLHADQKKQKGDANLGNGEFRFAAADKTKPVGPDERPCHEVSKHRAKPKSPENHDAG
jgi:hypothetical protein